MHLSSLSLFFKENKMSQKASKCYGDFNALCRKSGSLKLALEIQQNLDCLAIIYVFRMLQPTVPLDSPF